MTNMATEPIQLAGIVARLGGELLGNANTVIKRVASLQNAGPCDITFLSKTKYRQLLRTTKAAAVILPRTERDLTSLPRILCDDPYLYFAEVTRLLSPELNVFPGIHPTAVVEDDATVASTAQIGPATYVGHRARVGERSFVGPGCYIGDDSAIGDDARFHANIAIYPDCRIGHRAIVHAGVVIGADGFGMALKEGAWLKIPQTGRVLIGDDVEIGANSTIDRGALDDTIIEDGVKLDNQIQVGHNVRIGAHSALAGCVGIAGSAHIGRHCTVGGGAIILGHLEIADHVHISAATVITKSISKPGKYTGAYPFSEHLQWGRSASVVRNLDSLATRVRELEALVAGQSLAIPHNKSRPKVKVRRTRESSKG